MLLKHLFVSRFTEELKKRPQGIRLVEDASQMLHFVSAAIKNDSSKINNIDIDELADVITALKLLMNSDHRAAMTKDDVGINPNNSSELLKILDAIPRDVTQQKPKVVKDFVRAVASMGKSLKAKEVIELKALFSKDSVERKKAENAFVAFTLKMDQMINKLKTSVK